jgi:hypothetical protein
MIVAVAGGLTGAGTFNIPLWVPDAVLTVSGVFLVLVALLFPAAPPEPAPGEAEAPVEAQGVA